MSDQFQKLVEMPWREKYDLIERLDPDLQTRAYDSPSGPAYYLVSRVMLHDGKQALPLEPSGATIREAVEKWWRYAVTNRYRPDYLIRGQRAFDFDPVSMEWVVLSPNELATRDIMRGTMKRTHEAAPPPIPDHFKAESTLDSHRIRDEAKAYLNRMYREAGAEIDREERKERKTGICRTLWSGLQWACAGIIGVAAFRSWSHRE